MIILVVLLFALFASLFGLSKVGLEYGEPFFLIGSRFLLAGILLIAHQLIYNRKNIQFRLSHLTPLFFLGLINIYLTNVAEISGIKHMTSAKACLIYSLSPPLAALVAYCMLRETLDLKKWLGLCIGFSGVIPTFMIQSQSEQILSNVVGITRAEIALLIAVFSSVLGWALLKKIINIYNYSPLMANGISMTLGGILALFHSYFSGEVWDPIPITEFKPYITNTLWMCIISNIICYNLYGFLLKTYSATFMSFAGLITPFFASLFGWYFLSETITWHFFASIFLFFIGLILFNDWPKKNKISEQR